MTIIRKTKKTMETKRIFFLQVKRKGKIQEQTAEKIKEDFKVRAIFKLCK